MSKFHISKGGKVQPCKAKVKPCPLGGGHFDSKDAGEKYLNDKSSIFVKHDEHIAYDGKYSTLEANRRGNLVAKETKQAFADLRSSSDLYYNKETGKWSEEREALHEEILNEFREKYKDVPSNRRVVFSAGLPGAGKTTVLTQYEMLEMKDWATVSSDDMKEMLAEKGAVPDIEGLSPMERSTLVHEESSHLADKILSELGSEGKDVIYDFTCKSKTSTERRIKMLTDVGYKSEDMQFTFVDITTDVAKERAKARYTNGLNQSLEIEKDNRFAEEGEERQVLGGRYLPSSIIEGSAPKGSKYNSVNAENVISLYNDEKYNFPRPKVYDNSGSEPRELSYDEFLTI